MEEEKGEDAVIIPVSIATNKPMLTKERNKVQRVLYCCDNLNPQDRKYHDYYNSVHVDEKWFFYLRSSFRYTLHLTTTFRLDTSKTKSYSEGDVSLRSGKTKIKRQRCVLFYGKIGMWPSVEYVPAQQASENCPRGTMITKPLRCGHDCYQEFMLQRVLPPIKEKRPDRNRSITIQQDGQAGPILENDVKFSRHAQQGHCNIKLSMQPPNSPDLYVLDLSFFRDLRSAQRRHGFAVTINGLLKQYCEHTENSNHKRLTKDFSCNKLARILVINVANDYKLPHVGKDAMIRAEGTLPARFDCSDHAMEVYHFVMR